LELEQWTGLQRIKVFWFFFSKKNRFLHFASFHCTAHHPAPPSAMTTQVAAASNKGD
jgi:hypothetical protein